MTTRAVYGSGWCCAYASRVEDECSSLSWEGAWWTNEGGVWQWVVLCIYVTRGEWVQLS